MQLIGPLVVLRAGRRMIQIIIRDGSEADPIDVVFL